LGELKGKLDELEDTFVENVILTGVVGMIAGAGLGYFVPKIINRLRS